MRSREYTFENAETEQRYLKTLWDRTREPKLPTDSAERKAAPVYSGVLNYFPLALAEVARLSKASNDKHNPGEPLHWSRDKSNDHLDCLARHLLEAGKIDPSDGFSHTVKVAWRSLAALQEELEKLPMNKVS